MEAAKMKRSSEKSCSSASSSEKRETFDGVLPVMFVIAARLWLSFVTIAILFSGASSCRDPVAFPSPAGVSGSSSRSGSPAVVVGDGVCVAFPATDGSTSGS